MTGIIARSQTAGRTLVSVFRSGSIIGILAVFLVWAWDLSPQVTTDGEKTLLQFTAAGHVLGFSEDGVIVASARHMLRTDFLDARAVFPEADGQVPGESSAGEAPPLGRVTYRNLWDGVTLVYEASEGAVAKSTYYLDATEEGVPVDLIRLGYNRPLRIDEKGNLLIIYEDGTMTEGAPVAWQETEDGRKPVTVSYDLRGESEVGFSLGDYAPGIPVVIDPVMTWNSFLGGSDNDFGYAIAVDGSGNVYVAGQSKATWGSPVRAHYGSMSDAFVARFDSSGNLTWNTFLGGNWSDEGNGIAVDGSGNVYVAGYSWADWGSPVLAYTSGMDAFAAKLDTSGNLTWSTFLGGSGNDKGYGIAADGSGNVYVGGQSNADWGLSPVRAYTASDDAFAARLDSSGNLTWNTFLGGSGADSGFGIAVDGSGNVYVGGKSGADWGSPVRAHYGSGSDAFAAKLDSSGNLTWNSFLGGSGTDFGKGIAVDGSGNVYVAGKSNATWGSPVRAHTLWDDAFAAKLDSSGALTWNTFLGGSGEEPGQAIAVDGSGNVYVAGYGDATWGSPVRAYTSGNDAYAARLDSSGNLTWNTFLGGSSGDEGYGIAVDGSGNAYVAGYSGATWGSPVRAHYGSGSTDAFVAKLDLNGNFVPPWASYNDAGRATPDDTFASPETTVYMEGTGIADVSYLIAYYDADGAKVWSETRSASGGVLTGAYTLNADPFAAAGTWHALVQPSSGYTGFGTDSYATIAASPATYGLLADDSFTVEASAIIRNEINLKQSTTNIPDEGSHDYGSKVSGSNTDVEFTIENTGTADLTLTTPLTLGGADAGQFSIQAQPTSPVSASGSTTFTVRFSPTSVGAKTATVAIANNDSDENPYDLTLNGTGTVGALNYVKVEDAADGVGSEVTTYGMTADDTYTVYAAGYDQYGNFISDQTVTWTGTGVCESNLSPASGTSTTFTAVTAGTGTITADHASVIDDVTGTITVGVGALNYVKVEDAAGGTGSEVITHSMTAGQTYVVYAAGYDLYGNYISDQSVTWTGSGVCNSNLSPASDTSTTFTAVTAGTGTITADHATATDDVTGTITVGVGAAASFVVTTEHSGTETAGTSFSVTLSALDGDGNTATGYTGAHSINWTWTATNSPDGIAPTKPSDGDQTFTAGVATISGFTLTNSGETPTITAAADSVNGTSAALTVNDAAPNYVKVEDAANGEGSEVTTHGMTADQTYTVYAAGYDQYGNFISDQTVTWTGTGVCNSNLNPASGTSTTFTAVTPGTGTITANHASVTDDTTGTITVGVGALNYVKVEDAAGGTGSEVTTHSMTAGQTYVVYAAGYDLYGNYISDQSVTWTGSGVCNSNLSPASDTSTTFTAVTAGTGTITADHATATDDVTGTITVGAGAAASFTVTTEHSGTETAGTSFSVTLTAKDGDSNTATGYTGSHSTAWTWTATNSPGGTAPTKPSDGSQTFTAGVAAITGFTLTNSGETPTITATAGSVNGTSAALTVNATTPTVTTTDVSSITSTSASSGGNVMADGGASVTARGVCWSTSADPTTGESITSDGNGMGSFTSSITGLSPNTTYHSRAYATNSVGTSYGADMTFTTTAANPIISGNVSDPSGAGIEGVILAFLNNDSITSTDLNGNYSNTSPYGWTGTVNPQKVGYVFEPENRSYTDVIQNQTGGNFTGYPPPSVSITSPIFGSVLLGTVVIEADASSVTGISNVEFYIDNSMQGEDTLWPYEYSWNTTADSDGGHEIKVIAYNEKGQTAIDQVDVHVNNTQAENSVISGQVRDSGNNGIDGVTVTFELSGGVSTTDEDGFYSQEVLLGWSGTVILSKPAFKFDPASRSYDGVISNQDNQDYYGEQRPEVEISGDITWNMVLSSDFCYLVTEDINVPEGVSLILEPGVVVCFEEGSTMTIDGEFTALGTEEEPIVFMPESGNPEGLNFYGEVISLSYCVISNVTGTIRIGEPASNVSGVDYRSAGNTRLIRVDHCTFINILNGIVITGTGSDNIRFENNIVKNADYGSEFNLSNSDSGTENIVIKNNIFTQIKDTALKINKVPSSYEISGNSFFNNGNWDVYFESGVNDRLNMRNNYWGTKNSENIPDRIYDNNDDPSKGTVEFDPFLTEPCPDAPAQISAVDVSPSSPLPIGLARFTFRFNCRMDMLQEAWVSFGRVEPYEDYTIKGSWEDEWTWSGIYGVTGTTEPGVHTIKVSRAKGTDVMEVTNEYSHKFEISKSVTLTLEASRKKERAVIVTQEYGDIQFLVENFNNMSIERYVIYRKLQGGVYKALKTIQESEIVNGQYSFYDKYLMPDEQYTYKIVAVDSKGVIRGNSNEKTI